MLSPADRAVVARDPALPGLATLLDPGAAAGLVARVLPDAPCGAPSVDYTRYKPGVSCLTALLLSSPSRAQFITMKAIGVDAQQKWANALVDPRVVTDSASRVVLRQFPDDGELRGPRWLLESGRRDDACAALGLPACEFGVLAYKPERRLVLMAREHAREVALIKCYDAAGYAHALGVHAALTRADVLHVSRASAWNDRRRTIAFPWIHGRVPDIGTEQLWWFELAGRALARLHGTTIEVAPPDDASVGADALHRRARDTAACLPDVLEPMLCLSARIDALRGTAARASVPIHGDFYAKQLLVTESGVALLDFDECAMGDPHVDLATFCAHLDWDVLRGSYSRARADAVQAALIAGYRRLRPVDEERLIWRTSEAILGLAPHPFRQRDAEWPALTRLLIGRAAELLDVLSVTRRASAPRRTRSAGPSAPEPCALLSADDGLSFATALFDDQAATRALGSRTDAATDVALTVERTTLLRHKRGRRCLLAFDVINGSNRERWLGKVRARGVDWRGAEVHRLLWDAGARMIPEPLGVVVSVRMTLQREVTGVPLLDALGAGSDPSAIGAGVARSLHSLHALPVSPSRSWSVDDELRVLQIQLESLVAAAPTRRTAVSRLMTQLREVAMPLRQRTSRTVVHRDFYHDQAIWDSAACRLVDLDLVAVGDPALDVGNFIAHLMELSWRSGIDARLAATSIERFAAAYMQRAKGSISHDAVSRYTTLSLARLVAIASRRDDRRQHVPVLLERLEDHVSWMRGRSGDAMLLEVPQWHLA